MDSEAVRASALAAAAIVYEGQAVLPGVLTSYADQLVPWITQLPTVRLDCTLQLLPHISVHNPNGGAVMATGTAGVSTAVAITATPKDASDNTNTADSIGYMISDPSGVLGTPTISADTFAWNCSLSGVVGSATVTARSNLVPAVTAYVAQIDISAGATTHIVGSVTIT